MVASQPLALPPGPGRIAERRYDRRPPPDDPSRDDRLSLGGARVRLRLLALSLDRVRELMAEPGPIEVDWATGMGGETGLWLLPQLAALGVAAPAGCADVHRRTLALLDHLATAAEAHLDLLETGDRGREAEGDERPIAAAVLLRSLPGAVDESTGSRVLRERGR